MRVNLRFRIGIQILARARFFQPAFANVIKAFEVKHSRKHRRPDTGQKIANEIAKSFRSLIRSGSPFVEPPREKNVTWLEPRLVAQIAFQEWTADQKLRQPIFLRLRDDKDPTEALVPLKL
jgi:ATP-dependent DNA ligase